MLLVLLGEKVKKINSLLLFSVNFRQPKCYSRRLVRTFFEVLPVLVTPYQVSPPLKREAVVQEINVAETHCDAGLIHCL